MFIISSLATKHLSLLLESLGEAAHVVGESTLGAEELDVGTVDPDLALLALLDVLLALEGSETPVLGDDDLLATGELWNVSLTTSGSFELYRTLYWQRLRASRAVAR
jgi:hypothetical protein